MRRALLGSFAIACLLATGARGGDPDVAAFLVQKARKAFQAKEYGEAEDSYRRALEEHAPFPEAHYGLGETYEKTGRTREALQAYRACVREIGDAADPPRAWRSLLKRAERAVSRLQRAYADLTKLNDDFIRRSLAFAKRVETSDPAWARRACEAVLALDADNPVAKALLAKLPQGGADAPAPPAPPAEGGTPAERWGEPLIRGAALDEEWDGAPEPWALADGVVTGEAFGKSGQLLWLDSRSSRATTRSACGSG